MSAPTADAKTGEVTYTAVFDWPAGVHPAAELFPMMDQEAFTALVADIDVHGQRDPIWLDADGKLLDGRNRLSACQALGLTPITRNYEGASPTDMVLSLNVHRRHLTTSQKAAIAAEAMVLLDAEAEERRLANLKRGAELPEPATLPDREGGDSRDRAGKAVGVSGRSVQKARNVLDANKKLHDKVKAGEVSVTAAEREVKDSLVDDLRSNDDAAMKRHLHKLAMSALVGFTEVRKHDPRRVAAALPERDNYRAFDLLDAVESWLSEYREALAGADVIPMRSAK